MFEKEIKFIGDFCYNQVRSLGSSFTLDKISNAGVHPAVVQYISAELDFMIYSDRRKLLQQSYFDYAGKEISDHFQKISGEIKKHKKISLDDSKKLIFQAVSFNINYLVRPRWSLMKLIFNDQPVISVEEMRMLLNYLYYYEYFKKVLTGYISKRNLVQISSTEFDILLTKIDNELLNSDQHQVMSNSFTSMGDFFNIGGVDKNRLPLSAVEIFCKEKNLVDLILRLKTAIPNEAKRSYGKVEIERILFSPEAKQISEEEAEVEDEETKTEKMIEALDTEESESEVEEIEEKISDESNKSESETFLSPEEEEALLSLYSEENNVEIQTEDATEVEEVISEEETLEEIQDEVKGVKTTLELEEPLNAETEKIEEVTETSETVDEDKSELDTTEIPDEEPFDELISSDEELDGIVDAISDDLSENENELGIDEDIIKDGVESLETEIENETEEVDSEVENEADDVESELLKSEIENEIVQEMINDYVDSNPDDEATDLDEVETEEMASTEKDEVKAEEKIESLEDDLLNIFEGLDDEEFKFPEKERFSVDDDENQFEAMDEEKKAEEAFSSDTTDGFDEYLKSIDEIIFTDKPTTPAETKEPAPVKAEEKVEVSVEENKQIEEQNKVEVVEQIEKVDEVEEPDEVKEEKMATPVKEKKDKPSDTRNLRKKDLFKYLKRKEIKKIVSYIFANDEEDFTNTVERIMDCHSYKEASDILKAVFTSYKISPYSKEAITFTNAVSNYFRQA